MLIGVDPFSVFIQFLYLFSPWLTHFPELPAVIYKVFTQR